jgi:hypothetical protein
VFLTDEQYDFLHAERVRSGLSIGTLVRRAIDETYALEHRPRLGGWQASVGWWRNPDAGGGRHPQPAPPPPPPTGPR